MFLSVAASVAAWSFSSDLIMLSSELLPSSSEMRSSWTLLSSSNNYCFGWQGTTFAGLPILGYMGLTGLAAEACLYFLISSSHGVLLLSCFSSLLALISSIKAVASPPVSSRCSSGHSEPTPDQVSKPEAASLCWASSMTTAVVCSCATPWLSLTSLPGVQGTFLSALLMTRPSLYTMSVFLNSLTLLFSRANPTERLGRFIRFLRSSLFSNGVQTEILIIVNRYYGEL